MSLAITYLASLTLYRSRRGWGCHHLQFSWRRRPAKSA